MDAKSRTGEKEKKKEKEVTHSCVVRSLLCKAFMLQRKVLLREGEGTKTLGGKWANTLQRALWGARPSSSTGKHRNYIVPAFQRRETRFSCHYQPAGACHLRASWAEPAHSPSHHKMIYHTQSQHWDSRLDLLSYKNRTEKLSYERTGFRPTGKSDMKAPHFI